MSRLTTAVQTMNSLVNADVLCPMLLVFVITTAIPYAVHVLLAHFYRIRAMHAARTQYSSIVAKQRVDHGSKTRPPITEKSNVTVGYMVYVYREQPKKRIGPFPSILHEDKKVVVAANHTYKS